MDSINHFPIKQYSAVPLTPLKYTPTILIPKAEERDTAFKGNPYEPFPRPSRLRRVKCIAKPQFEGAVQTFWNSLPSLNMYDNSTVPLPRQFHVDTDINLGDQRPYSALNPSISPEHEYQGCNKPMQQATYFRIQFPNQVHAIVMNEWGSTLSYLFRCAKYAANPDLKFSNDGRPGVSDAKVQEFLNSEASQYNNGVDAGGWRFRSLDIPHELLGCGVDIDAHMWTNRELDHLESSSVEHHAGVLVAHVSRTKLTPAEFEALCEDRVLDVTEATDDLPFGEAKSEGADRLLARITAYCHLTRTKFVILNTHEMFAFLKFDDDFKTVEISSPVPFLSAPLDTVAPPRDRTFRESGRDWRENFMLSLRWGVPTAREVEKSKALAYRLETEEERMHPARGLPAPWNCSIPQCWVYWMIRAVGAAPEAGAIPDASAILPAVPTSTLPPSVDKFFHPARLYAPGTYPERVIQRPQPTPSPRPSIQQAQSRPTPGPSSQKAEPKPAPGPSTVAVRALLVTDPSAFGLPSRASTATRAAVDRAQKLARIKAKGKWKATDTRARGVGTSASMPPRAFLAAMEHDDEGGDTDEDGDARMGEPSSVPAPPSMTTSSAPVRAGTGITRQATTVPWMTINRHASQPVSAKRKREQPVAEDEGGDTEPEDEPEYERVKRQRCTEEGTVEQSLGPSQIPDANGNIYTDSTLALVGLNGVDWLTRHRPPPTTGPDLAALLVVPSLVAAAVPAVESAPIVDDSQAENHDAGYAETEVEESEDEEAERSRMRARTQILVKATPSRELEHGAPSAPTRQTGKTTAASHVPMATPTKTKRKREGDAEDEEAEDEDEAPAVVQTPRVKRTRLQHKEVERTTTTHTPPGHSAPKRAPPRRRAPAAAAPPAPSRRRTLPCAAAAAASAVLPTTPRPVKRARTTRVELAPRVDEETPQILMTKGGSNAKAKTAKKSPVTVNAQTKPKPKPKSQPKGKAKGVVVDQPLPRSPPLSAKKTATAPKAKAQVVGTTRKKLVVEPSTRILRSSARANN